MAQKQERVHGIIFHTYPDMLGVVVALVIAL